MSRNVRIDKDTNNVVVQNTSVGNVVVTDTRTEVVKVSAPGPRGPKGPAGADAVIPDGTVSSSLQLAPEISGSWRGWASSSLFTTFVSSSAAASGFGGGGIATLPAGVLSSSAQIAPEISGAFAASSASLASRVNTFEVFNGNKVVSNTEIGGLYTNAFNAGTSGSIVEFINAVFFPNTEPSISSSNFSINEFETPGTVVGTVTATDAEGQSITFATASSYTSSIMVNVASNGQLSLAVSSSASFNTTNRGDGTLAHPVPITATDTFGEFGQATVYVRVIPNTAPKFRLTGVGGSIVTELTGSVNENTSQGTTVSTIYFTDSESDTITIATGSGFTHPNAFTFNTFANRFTIVTATSSFDFETTSSYNIIVTASDQHYASGADLDAIAYLPVLINVTNNIGPSVNNQIITGVTESAAGGTSAGFITATDPESDAIVYSNFTISSGSGGGNSGPSDPSNDPFQVNSGNGQVTLKNSQFLNADIFRDYKYNVTVTDAFNSTTSSAIITIPLVDDPPAAISANGVFYVIESAVSGAGIFLNTNGRSGTQARFTANQSVSWEVNPSSRFAINSSGYLAVSGSISGSSDTYPGTIAASVTASNSFGTTTKLGFNINLSENIAPDIIFTDSTVNQNTNLARPGNKLVTITFSDPQGDAINYGSFVFTSGSTQLSASRSGSAFIIEPSAGIHSLSGSVTYGYSASIENIHGFRTNTEFDSFTVAQAPNGTLTTNGTFYAIESAVSGNNVVINSNGYSGTQGDLGVTYSPNYGSAAVASFTSSNAAIAVASNGNLTLGANISGSATESGDSINSNITYRDQYGNIGSGSISVNVTAASIPNITFNDRSTLFTASLANSGVTLTEVTSSDPQGRETITNFALSGGQSGQFTVTGTNGKYTIAPNTNLAVGTYSFTGSATNSFGKTRNSIHSIGIVPFRSLVYVYGYNGGSPTSEAQAIATLGASGGGTAVISGSVIGHFQSGSIGDSFTPSYVGGSVSLITSSSITSLTSLDTLGFVDFSSGQKQLLVLFASASNLSAKPDSMYDGVPPASPGQEGRYYVYAKDASIPGTIGTGIYYFDLLTAEQSYSRWGLIFAEGQNSHNSRYYLVPDSGSAP